MYSERTRLRPYSLPNLYFPSQSDWQPAIDRNADFRGAGDFAVNSAIARAVASLDREIDVLESSLIPPAAFDDMMSRILRDVSGAAVQAGYGHHDFSVTQAGIESIDDRRQASAAIYDRFFRVERNNRLSQHEFAACLLSAFARVISDLPFTTISRAETLILLRAMACSLSFLSDETENQDSSLLLMTIVPENAVAPSISSLHDAWNSSAGDQDWITHVADFRWIAGHHVFFIFANLCRANLDSARIALTRDQHEAVARHLENAAILQRVLASAMWYAGDFPPALYRSHTRAWMSSAGSVNGFSGSDNIDYADLHKSKGDLFDALFGHFGSESEHWPSLVERALRTFHEAEVQHAEHHVQIAARMIGSDLSLVQKRMTRVVYNAVDVLRDMVAEEWAVLGSRFS